MYRHCPSAKTVSKAREDLPEPETPVMTVTRSWGMARETFFRLFCLAPSIRSQRGCAIRSVLLRWKVYLSMHRPGNRTGLTALGQFASPYFVASGPASPQRTPTYASGCRPARAWQFEPRAQPEARAELIWLATCPSASAHTGPLPAAHPARRR